MKRHLSRYDDLGLFRQTMNKVYIGHIKRARIERKEMRTEYLQALTYVTSLPVDTIRHIVSFMTIPIKNPITNGELCDDIFKQFKIDFVKKRDMNIKDVL